MLTSGAPAHEWTFLTDADEDTQRRAVADCDVLVCSRLSAEVAAAVRASLVQVTGAGLDRVAVDALPAGSPRAIGGAAIDVWRGAPTPGRTPPADHDFTALDNVVLTPHSSGHAESTFVGRAADLAANVERLATGTPRLGVLQRRP